MELRDPATGQIKTWVIAAIGVVGVLAVFILAKVGGGQSTSSQPTTVTGGQNSDYSSALQQLEDAIQNLNAQNPSPTPTPTPKQVPGLKAYTVLKGDTWNSIAAKFGMTLNEFYLFNPSAKTAGSPDQARGGGKIVQVFSSKPDTGGNNNPTTYKVLKGDTWTSIAHKFNITLQQFYTLNPTLQHRPNIARQGGRTVIVGTSNTH